jgi:predicted small secreted protein
MVVTMILILAGTDCNTAHGFGKDMGKAGKGIQDGTR